MTQLDITQPDIFIQGSDFKKTYIMTRNGIAADLTGMTEMTLTLLLSDNKTTQTWKFSTGDIINVGDPKTGQVQLAISHTIAMPVKVGDAKDLDFVTDLPTGRETFRASRSMTVKAPSVGNS